MNPAVVGLTAIVVTLFITFYVGLKIGQVNGRKRGFAEGVNQRILDTGKLKALMDLASGIGVEKLTWDEDGLEEVRFNEGRLMAFIRNHSFVNEAKKKREEVKPEPTGNALDDILNS